MPVAPQPAYVPAPIEEVLATISREKPDLVFAPHIETSAGIILPDDYLRAMADAVHAVGGLLVLDCIASGTIWVDMQQTGVDILISAPQKDWSGSPCCGLVMLSPAAHARIEGTTNTSFVAYLKKWLQIMEAYEQGGHAYHATLPTDALRSLRDVMRETEAYGFAKVRDEQHELGRSVRACWLNAASNRSQRPVLVRPVWWCATPATTTSKQARNSPISACRSPLASRCNATKASTSKLFVLVCSASTSCRTSNEQLPPWRRRWIRFKHSEQLFVSYVADEAQIASLRLIK